MLANGSMLGGTAPRSGNPKGGQGARGFAPSCEPTAGAPRRGTPPGQRWPTALACAAFGGVQHPPREETANYTFVSFATRAAATPVALILFQDRDLRVVVRHVGIRADSGFLLSGFDGRLRLAEMTDGGQRVASVPSLSCVRS